ncbi:reverse transcriptase family protein [Shewanella subflava]|uniref:Reverse transcriptase family protein n=1 Tax=Shewanella subflava TaxID=2986476 RepID=A0ABT3I5Z6_9GAMM|nr:reverse transcriptase family protein [Shewanella subflava]MCW3171417.1 reverse transcriptase family protein [Shewanella subflava]
MDKPLYPCKPIGSIDVLASTLGVHRKKLIEIASKVNTSYTSYDLPEHPITGKVRKVVDPKHELKKIQRRINSRIFEQVIFPPYLHGGIKATPLIKRDYVENASQHGHSQTLINLDVKNFYPNIKAGVVSDIFKYFFRFNDDVVELLTKITTYNGSLPQGGCTSSYLANLVFFNSEYKLVSSLRGKSIRYTRLLDDITISSQKTIDNESATKIIKKVAAMLKKSKLSLKSNKTKITDRSEMHKEFEVTGLWVQPKKPQMRKKDVKYVRQLVFECEKLAAVSKTSDTFHSLWNKTSGLVAKLSRLNHSQAINYRARLSNILPEYDQESKDKLVRSVNAALKVPVNFHTKWGVIKKYNLIIYKLGILARTNKVLAKNLRNSLKKHYSSVMTIDEFWG